MSFFDRTAHGALRSRCFENGGSEDALAMTEPAAALGATTRSARKRGAIEDSANSAAKARSADRLKVFRRRTLLDKTLDVFLSAEFRARRKKRRGRRGHAVPQGFRPIPAFGQGKAEPAHETVSGTDRAFFHDARRRSLHEPMFGRDEERSFRAFRDDHRLRFIPVYPFGGPSGRACGP